MPPVSQTTPEPDLQLVCLHADFVIVHKPAGLSFHQQEGSSDGLMPRARQLLGDMPLWPVHRLDQLTSGLVILARHADAARDFGELFSRGLISKYYLALSARAPRKKQGAVRGAMSKGRNGSWRLTPQEGLPCLTQFFSYGTGDGQRLFVVRPRTGRTHQIRVALKSLGSPILGDMRYGGGSADRGYLHAWGLDFDWQGTRVQAIALPQTGVLWCDAPLAARLQDLTAPWELPWPNVSVPEKSASECAPLTPDT